MLYEKSFNIEITKVPNSFVDFYKPIPYKILIRPLVIDDKERGKSLNQLAIKYNTTKSTIRNILRQTKIDKIRV